MSQFRRIHSEESPIDAWLIVAVVAPALLTAILPRRWLLRGLIAWVLSPVAGFLVMVIVELLTRPPAENTLGNAFYGFMLISSFITLPWLVLCLIGFGGGFILRRDFRKPPNRPDAGGLSSTQHGLISPKPKPKPELELDVDAHIKAERAHSERFGLDPSRAEGMRASSAPHISNPPTTDWREANIGFANSDLAFDGQPVWTSKWRPVDASPLQLPHPAHPHQIHSYDIYDIGPTHQPTRFAAAELSNGVWGFYLPPNPPASSFDSADGSLRIEQRFHDPFDARDEPRRSWAVLIDAMSDRVLVDCSGWEFSHTVCNPDGTLLLRLQSNGFDSLFRINPATRHFCDVGAAGVEQPMSVLAQVVEQARRLTDERERTPSYRRLSSDGAIRVDLCSVEWSNSHWVNSPRVVETASGRSVLDLWHSDWDAAVSFPAAHVVKLGMRRYCIAGSVALVLDFARDTYQIHRNSSDSAADTFGPIAEAAHALEANFPASQQNTVWVWHSSVAAGQAVPARTNTLSNSAALAALGSTPTTQLRLKVAVILALALTAIALVAFVAISAAPPKTHRLDSVPQMPRF